MATNATVTITYDTSTDPPTLILAPPKPDIIGPGTATWEATNCSVTIDFAGAEKGPFPASGTPDNPEQGVYDCAHKTVTSEPAATGTNGTWPYTVTLVTTDKGGGTQTDGAIVVKGNP